MTQQTDDPGYLRPPFPEQTQPWPGLACRMQPPLGRSFQPAEIAPLYVLLASHESGFTTGNVWGSTGGETGP